MKGVFQRIVAVAMSFLFLFSTLSLSVGMHFCGDHLVDFSIGRKAATCGMETTASMAPGDCGVAVMKCCTDLEILLQGQEDLKRGTDNYSFSQLTVVNFTPPGILQLIDNSPPEATSIQFKEYSPPPMVRKVHLFHEAFLI
jgi:hypothetical protein